MFTLEQRFGNDGYAFWFKLLELLGSTAGHYLDCNDTAFWEFLQAKTHLSEDSCLEILNLLSKLAAIDPELWRKRIVWSDHFLDEIAVVYRNRRVETPPKPDFYTRKPESDAKSKPENPESRGERLEERRVNKNTSLSIGSGKKTGPRKSPKPTQHQKPNNIKTPLPNDFQISEEVRKWAEKHGFDRLAEHLEAFKDRATAKGYQYIDWHAAFKNAVREDWAKIRQKRVGGGGHEERAW
jgi:Domain of unknown function (DUF4373)